MDSIGLPQRANSFWPTNHTKIARCYVIVHLCCYILGELKQEGSDVLKNNHPMGSEAQLAAQLLSMMIYKLSKLGLTDLVFGL